MVLSLFPDGGTDSSPLVACENLLTMTEIQQCFCNNNDAANKRQAFMACSQQVSTWFNFSSFSILHFFLFLLPPVAKCLLTLEPVFEFYPCFIS